MAGLRKRKLTKAGLMVTELGLGAMDTSQAEEGEETLHLALDLGISFVDTARGYEGSEFLIGQVIRARGGKDFRIATKTFSRTRDGAQHDVDRSLSVLGVNSVDLYQLHDVSTPTAWEEVMRESGALAGLQIARARGLVEYIGLSSHHLGVLEQAILCQEFDAVMLEYSAFFPDTARLIALAKEKDVGVIAMRPLGGSGRMSSMRTQLKSGYQGALTPATLLRYVLSNPDVSVAIPGTRFPSRIRENVETATAYEPLGAADRQGCEAEAKALY